MTTQSTIEHYMEKKATWRAEKAKRHPQDWRNQLAVDQFTRLAEQARSGDYDSDLMEKYERMAGDGELNEEAQSEILSAVGFLPVAQSLNDLLNEIVGASVPA